MAINYRKHLGDKCEKCGEPNKWLLEVHHKDENRANNNAGNLITLCCNCHRLCHLETIKPDSNKDIPWMTEEGDNLKFMFPRPLSSKLNLQLLVLLGSSKGNEIIADDSNQTVGLIITKDYFKNNILTGQKDETRDN